MRGRKQNTPQLRMILRQFERPAEGPGAPPHNLSEAECAVWVEVTSAVAHLTAGDRLALEDLCVFTVLKRELAADVRKKGRTQRDRSHGGMERPSASVKALRAVSSLLRQLRADLALTTSSRAGLYFP